MGTAKKGVAGSGNRRALNGRIRFIELRAHELSQKFAGRRLPRSAWPHWFDYTHRPARGHAGEKRVGQFV